MTENIFIQNNLNYTYFEENKFFTLNTLIAKSII